ncbi:hypothetical protein EBZ39_08260 [bacterium]|nr:hypothetical protein [bacterium]
MKPEEIIAAIDAGYDSEPVKKARDYIGASAIGHPCDAYLALSLRGMPDDPAPARLKRIFNLGHLLEDRVVRDLKEKADLRVWEVDGLTGRQFAYEAWGGHISCHTDGQVEIGDELMLLEVKSMNAASFSKLKAEGVKYSHPRYYAQVQMMMGMSGFMRTLFIAICKDNSEYQAQIVDLDPIEASFIESRVERVLSGDVARVAVDPADWRCKDCFKRSVCWGRIEVADPNCQTCENSKPKPDGSWHCAKHDKACSDACADYAQYIPKTRA